MYIDVLKVETIPSKSSLTTFLRFYLIIIFLSISTAKNLGVALIEKKFFEKSQTTLFLVVRLLIIKPGKFHN